MTLDEALIAHLQVTAGITALVSTRIYSFVIPQGATLPCIVIQRIDTPRLLTHDSSGATGDLASPRFQLDAWATTYASAKAIADAIRAELNGKTGSIGYQLETATVLGAVTGTGNATVITTCTGMTGSPITTNVAVTSGDSASTVGGKIRTALGNVANIASFLTVGGSGATVTLTRVSPGSEIADLNISIANGTCAGLTSAPTSANTAYLAITINAALVNVEAPSLEPETKLYRSRSDYIIWHEE